MPTYAALIYSRTSTGPLAEQPAYEMKGRYGLPR